MSSYCPDHPEILTIQRTGYPSWNQPPQNPFCSRCGKELDVSYDNIYEDEQHEFLCKECLLKLHEKEWQLGNSN